jgi:hypothetical protein
MVPGLYGKDLFEGHEVVAPGAAAEAEGRCLIG